MPPDGPPGRIPQSHHQSDIPEMHVHLRGNKHRKWRAGLR
jgi:hypothetical protein